MSAASALGMVKWWMSFSGPNVMGLPLSDSSSGYCAHMAAHLEKS
ncbi:MAG: hypothetical protein ACJAUG_001010 [Halioglobus sp.]|jgi:hypothetical protein